MELVRGVFVIAPAVVLTAAAVIGIGLSIGLAAWEIL